MVEVQNDNNYFTSLLQMALLILAAGIIIGFLRPSSFVGIIIFTIILELILLCNKFTQRISVDDISVTIVYYRFFSKKEIVISKSDIKSKLSKQAAFRGSAYWVLDILQRNKKVYSIDSRDGFEEDELVMLDDSLKDVRSVGMQ